MTDEERENRNPAPEFRKLNLADAPELFIKDLELLRVYLLMGQQIAATFNYAGAIEVAPGVTAYRFVAPRVGLGIVLRERPDKSGTLEDGRGVKVAIRKYTEDAS